MNGRWMYRILLVISAVTVASGLSQLFGPDLVLRIIEGESTPTSRHFFATIGMFMVLFGGMMLHALLTAGNHAVAVRWSGLQKLGAAAAVGLGVMNGVFSSRALAVAGFDLASGILILAYLRQAYAAEPLYQTARAHGSARSASSLPR